MGLALLKTNHHKMPLRQGEMSDAFSKSKYDIDVLIITRCQEKFPNCTTQ